MRTVKGYGHLIRPLRTWGRLGDIRERIDGRYELVEKTAFGPDCRQDKIFLMLLKMGHFH